MARKGRKIKGHIHKNNKYDREKELKLIVRNFVDFINGATSIVAELQLARAPAARYLG